MSTALSSTPKNKWSRAKKLAVAVGSLLGAAAAITGIYAFFTDPPADAIPRVTGDVSTEKQARQFRDFLENHDGQLIYMDVECSQYRSTDNVKG